MRLWLKWVGLALASLAALFLKPTEARGRDSGVRCEQRRIGSVTLDLVWVDLSDPEVRVVTCVGKGFPRGAETWASLIGRTRPAAAINGTYFDTRTLYPVGDVVVRGRLLAVGYFTHGVGFTADGRVSFGYGRRAVRGDWMGYESVLSSGPRLVVRGRAIAEPRAEGFRDPRVLGYARRSAIALTADKRLLLVTVKRAVSLAAFGLYLEQLGAVEALALDGGSSSALYCRGKTLTAPGRRLNNFILVYTSRQRLQEVAGELRPPGFRAPVEFIDPDQPRVEMRSVRDEQRVKGRVRLAVTVEPLRKMAFVLFRVDGERRAISNVAPFNYAWDSTQDSNGPHLICVQMMDAQGQILGSDEVMLVVDNPSPDAVSAPSRSREENRAGAGEASVGAQAAALTGE
jgi:hypothetical protein